MSMTSLLIQLVSGGIKYMSKCLTVQIYLLSQHSFVFHIVLPEIISTAQQARTLLASRHKSSAALTPATFHSFSAGLLSPLQQLTQTTRDEIFHHAPTVCENRAQWCQIHEVKHTHTAQGGHTSLFQSLETQNGDMQLCFCLWSAYEAWYNHSAWQIFHQTLWYYHSVIHYTMLFSQSLTQRDRNTNLVWCGELDQDAVVQCQVIVGFIDRIKYQSSVTWFIAAFSFLTVL